MILYPDVYLKNVKEISEEQYKKLLTENGYSTDNPEGFILGEKKEIYDKGTSLDDIISGHLFQWEQIKTRHNVAFLFLYNIHNFFK